MSLFSALSSSTEVFPGPAFADPSSAKGAAGDKTKKAAVLKYLSARVAETEHALGWLKSQGDGAKYREEEGKAVLMRLIAVMVDNEGRLVGRCVPFDTSRVQEEYLNADPPSSLFSMVTVPRSKRTFATHFCPTWSHRPSLRGPTHRL